MPKLNFNFKSYMENDNEKFSSGFSFKNELLSKRTYEFLKDKDVCLDDVNLDDNICKDIVDNASIETIGFYGDMISHDNLRKLCINKFWNYVFDFYDFSSHDKDDSKYLKKLVVYKYRKDDK